MVQIAIIGRPTMGMSKKMLQKAYETNTLDELLHRFTNNSISSYGDRVARYLFWWRENKLIIGPTIATSRNGMRRRKK